jgi:hypothetical protein
MTKEELIAKCKAENSVMIQTVNGEARELTPAEYEEACENWAEMRLIQIAYEEKLKQEWETKVAAYQKLGLTPEEIEAIAPTPQWLLP